MSNDMDDGSSEDYYNHYFGQTEKNNYAQEVGQFFGQTEQVGLNIQNYVSGCLKNCPNGVCCPASCPGCAKFFHALCPYCPT